MRRSSYTPIPPEPLIVVEEAEGSEEEADSGDDVSTTAMEKDIAEMLQKHSFSIDEEEDAALLCPWRDPRDLRKRSLPTPSCTSGITASQVRRLSERSAATVRQSEFLATLTSAPAPGRRHSVTISRIPTACYPGSKGRRESIAALPFRRDSAAASFNLHLDIMDDIAEIKGARKAKMKMYKTSSREEVCELSTDDDNATIQFRSSSGLRAPFEQGRRHSDSAGFVQVPTLAPRRKSSEQLSSTATGIVCTNTDLLNLLHTSASTSTVTTETTTIANQPMPVPPIVPLSAIDEKTKSRLNSRSNSFDVCMINPTIIQPMQPKKSVPGIWFGPSTTVGTTEDNNETVEIKEKKDKDSKVVWDKPSGSVVDAQVLGSAIEGYLRRTDVTTSTTTTTTTSSDTTATAGEQQQQQDQSKSQNKDGNRESSSLCSTFKDLFVK